MSLLSVVIDGRMTAFLFGFLLQTWRGCFHVGNSFWCMLKGIMSGCWKKAFAYFYISFGTYLDTFLYSIILLFCIIIKPTINCFFSYLLMPLSSMLTVQRGILPLQMFHSQKTACLSTLPMVWKLLYSFQPFCNLHLYISYFRCATRNYRGRGLIH